MKTAMQELIEFILSIDGENKLRMKILSKADSLLQKEKEQILSAWIADDNELQKISAEKYYYETHEKGR